MKPPFKNSASPTVYRIRRYVTVFVAVLIGLLAVQPAQAHPADMFFQSYTILFSPKQVAIEWSISPGPLLANTVWYDADRDQNETVDPDEARAWVTAQIVDFTMSLDDEPLDWSLEAVHWPVSLTDFQLADEVITLNLSADWPQEVTSRHRFTMENTYADSITIHWFQVEGDTGITFSTPRQERGGIEANLIPDEEGQAAEEAGGAGGFYTYWDSGMPSLGLAGEGESAVNEEVEQQLQNRRTTEILTGLVRETDMTAGFYITALGISLVLGALHALTPGHGKALVAAYLVGARGTLRHAAALGGIVTLTHTGSVLSFGVLTLIAARFFVPTTYFPVLEILSGLLIVGLGINLLVRRIRGYRAVSTRSTLRHMKTDAEQTATGAQPEKRSSDAASKRIAIGADIPVRVYDDFLPDGGGAGALSWRSLVALGVSGGLVPCPDAIAILLIAIAINRITLGLSLVVSFSLGLAVVLIGIGIAVVRSRRLLERFNSFDRVIPALPVVSAVVVLGLGLVLTLNAARNADALVSIFRPSDAAGAGQAVEQMNLKKSQVLYMAPDEENRYQIYALSMRNGEIRQLTDEPLGVWDYQPSPDRETIVYTSQREGGSDLWKMKAAGSEREHLLDCVQISCSSVAWAPDGERLVYQRLDAFLLVSSGLPSLWWVEVEDGSTGPLFQDEQQPGFSPGWSPDGQWLSYTSPASTATSEIFIYNLRNGNSLSLPSQTGAPASWRPDSKSLLVTDAARQDDQYLTHLMWFNLETEGLTDLSARDGTEDMSASWSPDGEWIAVVRRDLQDSPDSFENQLWLIQPESEEKRQLTSEPDYLNGTPVWSPDGRYLLFTRFKLKQAQAQPAIWLLDIETLELEEIALPGNWPEWLPG